MSWTQVYLTGLAQTADFTDEEIENQLVERYNLSNEDAEPYISWAGVGSTLFKRDKDNICRGYAFLSFLSLESAEIIVERINTYTPTTADTDSILPPTLRAELSKPKAKPSKKKKNQSNANNDYSDVRLRHRRAAPVRKHPVIVSSDKKKTGLGNKTR